MMTSCLQDVRFALRMLVKKPGLAAVMIVTLGLAIGANTTVFSIVDSVLIAPLPYPHADRLVRLYTQLPSEGRDRFRLSNEEYRELVEHTTSFEAIGAWNEAGAPVSGGTEPVRVPAVYVTGSMLRTVGVAPMLGNLMTDADNRFGAQPVVVLSERLWRRAFSADVSIIGRKISVDGAQSTVIAVMPAGFAFPRAEMDLWIPITWWDPAAPEPRDGNHSLDVIARLRPGVTLEQARADLAGYMAWSKQTYVAAKHPLSAVEHPIIAVPLSEDIVGSAAWSLLLLQAAVAFLVLIASVNIASVLLARADARSREMAIRRAVGAHGGRIVRQLLTEALVLGVLGALLGIAIASWGVELAVALLPESAPRKHEIELSARALAIGVGVSLVSSVLFGLAPALRAASGGLTQASTRMTSGKSRLRLRRLLVVSEIALAVVLVVGCSLMLRSFARLQRVDTGFEPDHLISMRLELPKPYYPDIWQAHQFWFDLQARTNALPGVRAATVMGERPLSRVDNTLPVWATGSPPVGSDALRAGLQQVGERYPETMGIRLLRGRALDRRDRGESATVPIMVNESLAHKLWPGQDAVGKSLTIGIPEALTEEHVVVGVLADIKQDGLARPALPLAYFPMKERDRDVGVGRVMLLAVRTHGDPRRVIPEIRQIVQGQDPRIALSEVLTMDELLWEEVARPRFLTVLLATFAGLALLLATIGIFGVMSHSVAQRTQEIGIRKALGSTRLQVHRMVLREGMTLVVAGLAIGLAAAVAINTVLAKLLADMLFEIDALDPWTFAGVPVVILAIGGLACWLPARKATRVDPMLAMRHE